MSMHTRKWYEAIVLRPRFALSRRYLSIHNMVTGKAHIWACAVEDGGRCKFAAPQRISSYYFGDAADLAWIRKNIFLIHSARFGEMLERLQPPTVQPTKYPRLYVEGFSSGIGVLWSRCWGWGWHWWGVTNWVCADLAIEYLDVPSTQNNQGSHTGKQQRIMNKERTETEPDSHEGRNCVKG